MLKADELYLPECFAFTDPVMQLRRKSGGGLSLSDRQLARIAKGDAAYQKRA